MSTTDDGAAEVAFDPTRPALLPGIEAALSTIRGLVRPGFARRKIDGWRVYEAVLAQAVRIEKREGSDPAPVEPAGDSVRDGGAVEAAARAMYEQDPGFSSSNGGEEHRWTWNKAVPDSKAYWRRKAAAALEAFAPQLDADLETAITTLLTQVGSSHEAYLGAKRDLVRAFLARHGAVREGEVGAGDNAAIATMVRNTVEWLANNARGMDLTAWNRHSNVLLLAADSLENRAATDEVTDAQLHAAMDAFYPGENWRVDLGCALDDNLRDMRAALKAARCGARAPVAGGEPVAPVAGGIETALKAALAVRPTPDEPTADISALFFENADYLRIVVEPKNEPLRRFRISRGLAEGLRAELDALLSSGAT